MDNVPIWLEKDLYWRVREVFDIFLNYPEVYTVNGNPGGDNYYLSVKNRISGRYIIFDIDPEPDAPIICRGAGFGVTYSYKLYGRILPDSPCLEWLDGFGGVQPDLLDRVWSWITDFIWRFFE